jgi:hypothetical protein
MITIGQANWVLLLVASLFLNFRLSSQSSSLFGFSFVRVLLALDGALRYTTALPLLRGYSLSKG